MSKFLKVLIFMTASAACALVLGACATAVTTGSGTRLALRSAQFATYAEDVFRLQNEVLDALAFVLDDAPDTPAAVLHEDELLTACTGLNEIAVRRRDGGGVRPLRDAATARSVPQCEAAALSAADWLERSGLESSGLETSVLEP